MSHASMAGYFLFFYNRYRKEEILKRKEEKLMSLLEVKNVKKIYTTRFGSNQVEALRDVNFTVERGEYVAIMGESGSGKTTLLNILAALDKPTEGKVYLKDRDLGKLKEKEIATFRRQNLGFVFQDFNLLDTLTGYENIALALSIQNVKPKEIDSRIQEVAKRLGIEEVLNKYSYQMSGGQKQRVAAARALITNPKLILADEPTGALDSKSSRYLLESMKEMNEGLAATILMVTHDAFTASYASRVIFIKDGKIFNEIRRGDDTRKQFFNRIIEVVTVLGGSLNDAL